MSETSSTPLAGAREVELSREPVELFKVLKFEGMVNSGGQAKLVIADGQVLVNGERETRKRRKLISGDTVEFNGQSVTLRFVAAGSAVSVEAAGTDASDNGPNS
ncbi:MAG: RNA-binding S4 domain-containing protein [Pseudomonadaceae bacterium]|nr:RNA-binding S4 domain-containing protein [Pseudomonadaceae bacterium]